MRNLKRNARLTTSRNNCQRTSPRTISKVGYHQSNIVPRLWTHKTSKTCFILVVDDFAIKYTKLEDAQHLIDALKKDYTITINWDATKYIGLTIKWDYTNRKVYIHMPRYLSKALLQFKNSTPKKNQNSPYPHIALQYGAKIQCTADDDDSHRPNKEETTYVQKVTGTSCTMDKQNTIPSSQH